MPNNRKRLVGRVVSDKMQKTVTVAIERRKSHPIYGKVIVETQKFLAHDETNDIPVGSLVRIVESKPLSKRKRWVVEEVMERPEIVLTEAEKGVTTQEPDQNTEEEVSE